MTYYPKQVLCAVCRGKLEPMQIVVRAGRTLCVSCAVSTAPKKKEKV